MTYNHQMGKGRRKLFIKAKEQGGPQKKEVLKKKEK